MKAIVRTYKLGVGGGGRGNKIHTCDRLPVVTLSYIHAIKRQDNRTIQVGFGKGAKEMYLGAKHSVTVIAGMY